MTSLTPRNPFTLGAIALALATSLAACSGGGGGSSPTPPGPSAPTLAPTTSPVATATPAVATASGKLVDFDSNTGLANVPVQIAPYTRGAALATVATTGADGSFSFMTVPGPYLIFIGSNSPTDTRATYHNKVTLVAGPNNIAQGVPSPEPQVTLSPAEQSGNFRLAALTSVEQDCMTGVNAGRTASSLSKLVPDENAFEGARAFEAEEVAQKTATPTPLDGSGYFYGMVGTPAAFSGAGFSSCSNYTNTYSFGSSSVPHASATDPNVLWFGAEYDASGYTNEYYLYDPR